MPKLQLSGRKHICSCGAAMTYGLHEASGVVLVGCTNQGCPRCFLRTHIDHQTVGEFIEKQDDSTTYQS